jgi:hypothetical protein
MGKPGPHRDTDGAKFLGAQPELVPVRANVTGTFPLVNLAGDGALRASLAGLTADPLSPHAREGREFVCAEISGTTGLDSTMAVVSVNGIVKSGEEG